MLSRKSSCAGTMSGAAAAAAADRSRVGERLQAALAGLHELHLLRDKQSEMVHWALRVDRDEPVLGAGGGTEEQRLEATLTALKQQLSRLRKQDVGLKTHLQQLDQQISELKLDVSKASSEQLESDSRPSSGFYELSDGGSCSLSNSCTSVYSESLSSSQTSLLLLPTSPPNPHGAQVDVGRRRSADENAPPANPPRATGLHLGSSRIRTNTSSSEQARPRPVSTGDLDAMMAQGLGCYRTVEARKPSVCTNLKTSAVDPKFQSHLVSRNGAEVYHYPSPLHAVALHSPIFSNGELAPGFLQGQGPPVNNTDSLQRAQTASGTKNHGYMDRLLLRSLGKIQSDYQRRPAEAASVFPEVLLKNVSVVPPLQAQAADGSLESNQKGLCVTPPSLERADLAKSSSRTVKAPEVPFRYSYPVATKEYSSDEVAAASLRRSHRHQGQHDSLARSVPESPHGDNAESRPQERAGPRRAPAAACSSSAEESRVLEAQPGHAASPQFVHAKFVPAGSERVKVRQADRKTKAVKLRRRPSEKPKTVRQHHGSGQKAREVGGGGGGSKGEQRKPGKGKAAQKPPPSYTEERRRGSGSDSSHSSPGLVDASGGLPRQHLVPAALTRSGKSRRLQSGDSEHPVDPRRKRQAAARWPSDVETVGAACPQRHVSRGPQAAGGPHMVRSASLKAGQWLGPHQAFRSSVSSGSFFHHLNARYPPVPFHVSSLYPPPRCESEYSAECASLFHSTIAESSDGETSDNTTNRFGDSESSQSFRSLSDSDSSLSLDEEEQVDSQGEDGGLVWADGALGPTAAGQPLQRVPRPEPAACRIKASRALKKKIRRFQPAALKVMTLV